MAAKQPHFLGLGGTTIRYLRHLMPRPDDGQYTQRSREDDGHGSLQLDMSTVYGKGRALEYRVTGNYREPTTEQANRVQGVERREIEVTCNCNTKKEVFAPRR